ncbi:MAG: VWA domain-containing protein [Acidobacteria bacterium]|nr:VWA domain-containing protein [Acidobacteriota bacterium]
MIRILFALLCAALAAPADETIVFRSDVALIRVDAQVVDRDNRAITGLRAEDFVLRDEGKVQDIRNFAREEMPVDFLFLLDVSASMRPHVERIAEAAHDAVRVLGPDDRFAIMVFDRQTRLRMPFRKGHEHLEREFENVLKLENFRGGTDITRGMYDAAAYIKRDGRKDARRAIVILTDDETELSRDDEGVLASLERGDTVMSALIAPDAMRTGGGYGGGGQGGGRNGGTWGSGGPLGGVIFGGPRGGPGGRGPGGPGGYHRTHSAGVSEIAKRSGGDSMPVDDSYALETTLSRIRQRYALHFYAPTGVKGGEQRNLSVTLSASARQRYPDAEVRFRRVYMVPDGVGPAPGPASQGVVAVAPGAEAPVVVRASSVDVSDSPAPFRRRRAVNEDGSSVSGPTSDSSGAPAASILRVDPGSQAPSAGWRRVDDGPAPAAKETAAKEPAREAPKTAPAADSQGGWRRVAKPDQQ